MEDLPTMVSLDGVDSVNPNTAAVIESIVGRQHLNESAVTSAISALSQVEKLVNILLLLSRNNTC